MSGRNPTSYCTLTLIAMQGHQQKGRQNSTSSNNKDKSNTIVETSTAEDHDDENLHNPETVQDAVIHLEVDEEQWAITQGSVVHRNTLGNGKSLSWMGPTRERWCCTRGLVSRLDMNTCQTSIKTDILL